LQAHYTFKCTSLRCTNLQFYGSPASLVVPVVSFDVILATVLVHVTLRLTSYECRIEEKTDKNAAQSTVHWYGTHPLPLTMTMRKHARDRATNYSDQKANQHVD
jgi:hypothetical protein